MADTYTEARNALLSFARTTWNANSGGLPLTYSNIDGERPQSVSAFGRATVRFTGGDIIALGTNKHRRTGFLFVQVFVPHGDGKTDALSIGEALVQAFTTPGQVDNIWFRRPGLEDIGSDGTYYQVNVRAEFIFDRIQ